MSDIYKTRHVGLAAYLLYQHSNLYISTAKIGPASTLFSFRNEDECAAHELAFFSSEGVATADARALLECSRVIRQTVAAAFKSPSGVYRKEDR